MSHAPVDPADRVEISKVHKFINFARRDGVFEYAGIFSIEIEEDF